MKKWLFAIICVSTIFTLAACGGTGIYTGVEQEILEQENSENYSGYSDMAWDARYLMIAKNWKRGAPIIIGVSVALGIFLSLTFRNVPQMLKIGVFGFILAIPYVLILSVYLLPYMYTCFGARIIAFDYSFYGIINYSKRIAPFLITGFELIGLFMVVAFQRVKQLQKVGVFAFMIGFPLLTFLMVYLLAFLYGFNWFLF